MEAARRVAWSIMADFKVKNAYKTGPTVKHVSTPAITLYWPYRPAVPQLSWTGTFVRVHFL